MFDDVNFRFSLYVDWSLRERSMVKSHGVTVYIYCEGFIRCLE